MTCENIVKNLAEFAYTCFTLINWINFGIHFRYSLIHRSILLHTFPNDRNSILCLHILIAILLRFIVCTFEPRHDKTSKISHGAPSKDSDQPGHPPSLIRVFAVR